MAADPQVSATAGTPADSADYRVAPKPVTRYFLDTEFMEDGHTIELISIGLYCEDGRTFYAENRYVNLRRCNDWVKENVVPHLNMVKAGDKQKGGGRTPTEIRADLLAFVGAGAYTPQFWAFYADYDWVALCQLFGRMLDLPDGWPMFCWDLKQWAVQLGDPRLPAQTSTEHHALADAMWNKEVWEFLRDIDGNFMRPDTVRFAQAKPLQSGASAEPSEPGDKS